MSFGPGSQALQEEGSKIVYERVGYRQKSHFQ